MIKSKNEVLFHIFLLWNLFLLIYHIQICTECQKDYELYYTPTDMRGLFVIMMTDFSQFQRQRENT